MAAEVEVEAEVQQQQSLARGPLGDEVVRVEVAEETEIRP